jgi:hypothetical protein
MADRTVTVGDGKTYASLNAALAAEFSARPDLTTAGGVLTIECYYISGGDTTTVSWPAFTNPTSSNYIKVVAVDRHSGVPNTTTAYYVGYSANPTLNVTTQYTQIIGLQFLITSNIGSGLKLSADYCVADGCLAKSNTGTDGRNGFLIDVTGTNYCVFKNCIAYECRRSGFYVGVSATPNYILNCTAAYCNQAASASYGAFEARWAAVTATNCLAYGTGGGTDFLTGDSGSWTMTTCASGDTSGSSGLQSISNPFADSANDDYHLSSGSGGQAMVDAGTDLYGNSTPAYGGAVTLDIDGALSGTTRNDIGAHEYETGGGGASPTITDAGDGTFTNGETGIVITGANFGASQGTGSVKISPTDNVADAGAITQTVTAWGATSVTFTAVRSTLPLNTTCYLFVTADGNYTNASGLPVSFYTVGDTYRRFGPQDAQRVMLTL